jgi:hypothetical protein
MYQAKEFRQTQRVANAIEAVLPGAAKLELLIGQKGHDLTAKVGKQILHVDWVSRGDLRGVLDRLRSGQLPNLLVAPHFTRAARDAATHADVSWIDETGAAEVVAGDIIIRLDGRTPTSAPRPPAWTPSVISVAEAILIGIKPTAEATAEATGHALSAAVTALKTLTELGLLEAKAGRGPRSGRRVPDPRRLLDEYARAASEKHPKFELRCGLLWRDHLTEIRAVGEIWNAMGENWAATGALGASLIAPYLTEVTTGTLYVDVTGEFLLRHMAELAGLEPMAGGRLILQPFPTRASLALATTTDRIKIAPWPRVYADVRGSGVRGEEAAEHLYEVIRARD